MLSQILSFLLIILACVIEVCYAYPFGAGLRACRTLIPGHGKEPQPMETLPFMIEPESDYFTPGRIFKVRIKTVSGKYKNRKIGGFFVQAREPGTVEPVGRWEVDTGDSAKFGMKGQNCSHPFDSITHSDSKPKNADLVLHFLPTVDSPDQIQFMGTIARDYGMFWANVKSTIVTKRVAPEAERGEMLPITHASTAWTRPPTVERATTHLIPTSTHPRRIHVTHHMPGHNSGSAAATHHPHKPSHHPRRTTTTTSTTPTPAVTTMKVVYYEKLDDLEKEKLYEDGKLGSGYHGKNDLEPSKSRSGQRDDEDRIQNEISRTLHGNATAATAEE